MSEPRSWFHWHGGVFFRRADDGAVEIGHGPGFDDVHVDHSIDANSWASIVSSVSARGENHVTFYEALEFHNVCGARPARPVGFNPGGCDRMSTNEDQGFPQQPWNVSSGFPMTPSVGRVVHYTLTESDAAQINKRRADARTSAIAANAGTVIHVGNPVAAGDVFPMIITRVWGTTHESSVQGQVFLDGNDQLWVTSAQQGDGPRQWHRSPQVA